MSARPGRVDAFAIFATAWAVAALAHAQWDGGFATPSAPQPSDALLVAATLAACAVLLRPSSPRRLLVLCAVQVADVLVALPAVPNHYALTGIAAATFLAAALWRRVALGRAPDAGALFAEARPFARLCVLVVYAFAFFWKLNDDFVDPVTSCARTFYGNIAGLYGVFPQGPLVDALVVHATLLVEGALVVLLVPSRTRRFALPLAVLFHYALALDAIQQFSNFSAVMLALLFLFAPEHAPRVFEESFPRLVRTGRALRIAVVALAGGLVAATFAFSPDQFLVWALGRHLLWLAYGLLALAFAVALLRAGPFPRDPVLPPLRSPLWLLPALALANGCTPVVGLKTRSAWQMYSNLRLDAAGSNHWLVPRSLDWFGELGDVVRVIETSDPELESLRRLDLGLTFHSLRLHSRAHPDLALTYERRGRVLRVARAGDDPELSTPPSLLARKLYWFGPVGERAGALCLW